MIVLLSMLLVVSLAQGRDYHYQRPHVAFHSKPHQPAKFVVQTLGPNSHTYDLEAHRAPAVYENHQTKVVAHQQQVVFQTAPQVRVQQQYVHQQQVKHQPIVYLPPQQIAPQQQQLHTTSYSNPLLLSVNYQQQTPAAVPPPTPAAPPQPINYYAPPQQPQVNYQAPQQPPPPPPPQYGVPPPPPPPQAQLAPQRLYFQNAQPYAQVKLPSGQQILDGGHGNGVAPAEVQIKLITSTGTQPQAPQPGDHIGQGQSSSLDGYKYKQAIPGDARDYIRYVNNCAPNGQCEQSTLNPGQVEPNHQEVLHNTRASTQPRIEGCTKSVVIYIPPGAAQNDQGQLRPRDRRIIQRNEEQLLRHPYN